MIVLANEGFGEGGNNSSGYQRKSRNAVVRHDIRKRDRVSRFASPQVSAGWFQRPYPYHLDYYRMRYGGSYAPYFGNLYGPPNVVLAQPYYGYGYDGYYGPDGGGYPYPGPVSPNMEVNPGAYPAESGMGELVEPALPGR